MAWIEQHPEAIISAISFLFGAITLIIQRQSGRKLINYRVHHDMQIEAEPAIEDMAELVVRRENEEVS